MIELAVAAAFVGSRLGRIGVRMMVPPSWTVTVSRSPALTRARSISELSKIMPCELPTFEIVFVTQ